VENGFNKAWWTIVDTHVTTIVSCAFLFPVRGRPGERIRGPRMTIGLASQPFSRRVFVSRTIFNNGIVRTAPDGDAEYLGTRQKRAGLSGR